MSATIEQKISQARRWIQNIPVSNEEYVSARKWAEEKICAACVAAGLNQWVEEYINNQANPDDGISNIIFQADGIVSPELLAPLANRITDSEQKTHALFTLGYRFCQKGNLNQTKELYTQGEALQDARKCDARELALSGRKWFDDLGDNQAARKSMERAITLIERDGVPHNKALDESILAGEYVYCGFPEEGKRWFAQALSRRDELESSADKDHLVFCLYDQYCDCGWIEQAEQTLRLIENPTVLQEQWGEEEYAVTNYYQPLVDALEEKQEWDKAIAYIQKESDISNRNVMLTSLCNAMINADSFNLARSLARRTDLGFADFSSGCIELEIANRQIEIQDFSNAEETINQFYYNELLPKTEQALSRSDIQTSQELPRITEQLYYSAKAYLDCQNLQRAASVLIAYERILIAMESSFDNMNILLEDWGRVALLWKRLIEYRYPSAETFALIAENKAFEIYAVQPESKNCWTDSLISIETLAQLNEQRALNAAAAKNDGFAAVRVLIQNIYKNMPAGVSIK